MRQLLQMGLCAIVLVGCSGSADVPAVDETVPPAANGNGNGSAGDAGASAAHDGGRPNPSPTPHPSSDAGASPPNDASTPIPPGPPVHDSGAPPPAPDSGTSSSGDGPPTRQTCTGSLGSSLSTSHARLDGYLVAVIPPGQGKQCNGDSTHVHLQVLMNSAVYDVAVNVDGQETELDLPLVGGAWSEGWHTQDALDYPGALGAHSGQFTLTGLTTVANALETELAQANHVAIFCTGYDATGCHLVHRNSGHDGAVVIDPLSPTAHWLLFDFSGDSF